MTRPVVRFLPLCLALVAFDASAVLVTMEADNFAAGTDVSDSWADAGITMQRVSWVGRDLPLASAPVYSELDNFAFTGTRSFGSTMSLDGAVQCFTHPLGQGCAHVDYGFSVLRLDFARPVDRIEVFGSYSTDPLGMAAFDSSGTLLEACYGYYSGAPCFTRIFGTNYNYASVQFDRSARDISTVLIGGVLGYASVDSMRVNVPEPATLGLMSIGLLGALVRRRRPQPA